MRKHVITLAAGLLLLLQACGEKNISPVDSDNNAPIANEVPTEVQTLLNRLAPQESENTVALDLSQTDIDNGILGNPSYDLYVVTFLWGQLLNTSPPGNAPTDWSGSLYVNGPSIVAAVAPISFEPGQDYFVPDSMPWAEHWVSETTNDFDGAVFLVFYDKDTPTFAQQFLIFETVPFSATFDFHQLIRFSAYYQVDEANGVAVHARRIRPNVCTEGFLAGNWIKDENSHSSGHFGGYWYTHNGDTAGYLNGIFWTDPLGKGLLQGQVTGLYTDQVIATLHGAWVYDDYRLCPLCGVGHGRFKGRFSMLTNGRNGYFEGEFGNFALPPNDRVMPFHGKWRMNCFSTFDEEEPRPY